ncbi:MAG TPA: TIM barrel protein [Tepidisphaeraceae bacterium]|jgi:sugar phosphate isomerase/epimerase|nr:TIM barrel protein [Tepidisphaeraceae bacterium]
MNPLQGALRVGGPVFVKTDDPVELARAHRDAGWSAALGPPIDPGDSSQARRVRDAFAAVDVMLAEVGAWGNMISPDTARRTASLAKVTRKLAEADALAARCCINYLGTLDPDTDFGPHPANLTPDAFDLAVETIRAVIDAVRPTRTKFCLEMMQWIIPDSVEIYADLIRAVDRNAFAAHVDPVNLVLTPRQYFDTGKLIRHAFAVLGPHVVSCHAKDVVLRYSLGLHMDEVPPGKGAMDYVTYLREIRELGRDVPLLIEHLGSAEEYEQARLHLAACDRPH